MHGYFVYNIGLQQDFNPSVLTINRPLDLSQVLMVEYCFAVLSILCIVVNKVLLLLSRPFERTIVLQKDSAGHVGFVFKNGKITQIAKDTSAAR